MRSLRAVLDHHSLDLVGLYVYSDAKAGVDAGTLCGLPPLGVVATRDVGEVVALGADCVLYMPFTFDVDDMVRILESGTNIVTTKVDFQNPDFLEAGVRARLEDACGRGGSSLFATGSSPGIGSEVVPATLLAFQRRLDRLTVDEYADASSYDSAGIVLDAMGFGSPPTASVVDRLAAGLRHSRQQSAHMLAEALGITLDDIEVSAEIGLATKRTEIAAGVVEAGTIAGTRITVSGVRDGEPVLTFRTNWYCTRDLDVDWGDLLHSGWRIAVEGDTPINVEITFPVPSKDYAAVSPGLTAHPAVNAVPAVCAARPGIVPFLDLPYILPTFS
jgi:4-hydroxy-tetrahydrodipicolinate reductase